MASLDLSQNGASINKSYKALVDSPASKNSSPTHASWAVFAVSAPLQNAFVQGPAKDSVVKVQTTGEGELSELIEEFNDGKVQFAFVKVKDSNSGLAKFVLIGWCGEGVPERVKGYFTGHLAAISKVLHGYHVQITARSESDLTPESIIQKVADASGAKYSAGTSSSSAAPTGSTRPPPPTAAKPAYKPSTTTGTSRSAAYGYKPKGNTDSDGWGEDAPQLTRSKLENVQSAYQPTKVDIKALKAMPTSTTSGSGKSGDDRPEVVKGAYVPVGKVDIAAIRAASKTKEDRPEPVKGAYQPIGKVDIAAIRAQAKPKAEAAAEEAPKSLSERSAAFSSPAPSQAERLTSLPKPKPAKKFGTGAPSFGTKPITPGGVGHIPSSAPVGTASKDFASKGGKTPAQLWAEKKARERGEPIPSAVSPTSTGTHTTAEVEEPTFSGVSAMKSKFAGAAPISAQYSGRSVSPPPPPSPPQDSRPSLAGSGAIAMPGFPPRPQFVEDDASVPPPPPPQPPRTPTPPSSPTPPMSSSPVRLVMPVGRGHEDEPVKRVEEEPQTSLPVESLSRVVPREEDLPEEEPARERGHVAAEIHSGAGQTARVEYDYEKADTNEIDLAEGEIITNIDKVDEDWWAGTNSRGETGLFPSNYVVIIEGEPEEESAPPPPPMASRPVPAPEPEPAASQGQTAIAVYDYEAAEGNEISFPEGAIIEDIEFPDDDWWEGTYRGQRGLFPANYVELQK